MSVVVVFFYNESIRKYFTTGRFCQALTVLSNSVRAKPAFLITRPTLVTTGSGCDLLFA